MNRHRHCLTSSRVGEVSSKYSYHHVENFEKDVENKQIVALELKNKIHSYLDEIIRMKIEYRDESVMSHEAKFKMIIEAVKDIKEIYNL